jgi:hypothetical protein
MDRIDAKNHAAARRAQRSPRLADYTGILFPEHLLNAL